MSLYNWKKFDDLISNILRIIGFFIMLAGLIYISIKLFSAKHKTEISCEKELSMSFAGVVSNIVIDEENLNRKFIIIDSIDTIITPYTYGLWIRVKPQDSIVKEEGKLLYYIYRNNYLLDSVYWDINCEDL